MDFMVMRWAIFVPAPRALLGQDPSISHSGELGIPSSVFCSYVQTSSKPHPHLILTLHTQHFGPPIAP